MSETKINPCPWLRGCFQTFVTAKHAGSDGSSVAGTGIDQFFLSVGPAFEVYILQEGAGNGSKIMKPKTGLLIHVNTALKIT